MNTNRTKYASTPTYGMQKRGFMKKNPARQAPEGPDFSKAPDPVPPMPAAPFPPMQQPGFTPPPAMPQGVFTPAAPYAAPGMPPSAAQIPFASPNFIQPQAAMQPPFQGFAPQPAQQPLPLGNSAPPVNPAAAGFSSRSQGYVPPAAPVQQPMRPAVQPAMFAPPAQRAVPSQAPGQPVFMPQQPVNPFIPQNPQQPGAGFSSMPQPQPFMPVPPASRAQPAPEAAQPMYDLRTPPPAKPAKPARERRPVNADQLWAVFLFGLLPLLFIPCLFVPSSLDVIRYAFLGLCVLGLGGMWYRQMFGSVTRLVVSMVYVALCVVTIVMMMQGGRDALLTGASGPQQPAVQSSAAPDGSMPGMAAPSATAAQPTPSPTASGPSEAERRLETFMALWQSNNPQEMVGLVQPSWASAQENPSTALFMLLANRTPEEYTIEDISGTDQDNSRTVTMSATINKNNGKEPSIYRFMVIMTKEGGEWYVDPNSLATNEQLTTTSDENVVNDLTVAAATSTPRTTVTPPPPADTTLYYNANGGSFYHMDAYCSSVDEDYLPLTGTFAYSDLKSYTSEPSNLKPCLKCGAPINPLE